MILSLCVTVVITLAIIAYLKNRNNHTAKMAQALPGPKCIPFIGNAYEFGFTTLEIFRNLRRIILTWGPVIRVWMGSTLFVILTHPSDYEIILGNTKFLDKAQDYDFLRPWLGNGLLTSTVPQWNHHRKILTPTFHFKILEQFVDVFNSNAEILIRKLQKEVKGPTFDIYQYITLAALDNICETAMGIKVNAQKNSVSPYVQAVRDVSGVVIKRGFTIWLRPDFIFRLSREGRLHNKSLAVLHGTTNKVIKQRKIEIMQEKQRTKDKNTDEIETTSTKKRLAFLDLLIEASLDENNDLTDTDIREEVDTFMFEGHDTTTSAISFTLWLLSRHENIQDKVLDEIHSIIEDTSNPITFQHLQSMKYTERVIKEALRLFPPVSYFGREASDDIKLHNGLVLPKGAQIAMVPFMTHRNPVFFPDPEKFDPERFSPENVQGRHPYAYVPFSAGSRNCIGQKFAFLEMKSTITHVLKSYKLLPATEEDQQLTVEVILKSTTGIKLQIVPR